VIVEGFINALLAIGDALSGLLPNIDWPDWLFIPGDWLQSASGVGVDSALAGVTLTGAFVWVHPDVYSMAIFRYAIVGAVLVIAKIARLLSLATGGGLKS